MTQIPRQSKWSDKIFQQPKYSPNSVPLLSMTAEQAVTSGQKRLQNAKQRVEVIIVQHPDRAKTVPELRIFHPTSTAKNAGTLKESGEYSGTRPSPTKSSRQLQTRQYGHYHHVKAMEMDRT